MEGHTPFLGPTAPLVIGCFKGKTSIVRGESVPCVELTPSASFQSLDKNAPSKCRTKQPGSNGNCLGVSFCCIEI